MKWLWLTLMPLIVVYQILQDGINNWTITSILFIILAYISTFIVSFQGVYLIQKDALCCVNDNKKIYKETIIEIDINSNSITIHTTKFRNELIIEKSKLIHPSWLQLESKFEELKGNLAKIEA